MPSLYSLAHRLLSLGRDGTPVYSDEILRLNREVYDKAYDAIHIQDERTPEEEAAFCLDLLAAFAATFYDDGRKQQYIQRVLERSFAVLPQLSPSLLKVRLLTYCYGEVYDEALAREAHAIINDWEQTILTAEQFEVMEELRNMEETPYPWKEIKD